MLKYDIKIQVYGCQKYMAHGAINIVEKKYESDANFSIKLL